VISDRLRKPWIGKEFDGYVAQIADLKAYLTTEFCQVDKGLLDALDSLFLRNTLYLDLTLPASADLRVRFAEQ
jgi:hypothetical protein